MLFCLLYFPKVAIFFSHSHRHFNVKREADSTIGARGRKQSPSPPPPRASPILHMTSAAKVHFVLHIPSSSIRRSIHPSDFRSFPKQSQTTAAVGKGEPSFLEGKGGFPHFPSPTTMRLTRWWRVVVVAFPCAHHQKWWGDTIGSFPTNKHTRHANPTRQFSRPLQPQWGGRKTVMFCHHRNEGGWKLEVTHVIW